MGLIFEMACDIGVCVYNQKRFHKSYTDLMPDEVNLKDHKWLKMGHEKSDRRQRVLLQEK